ncbi:PoNi-like cognate immunity protein [Variovorax sp. PAMC26660]|uniref:PoNi-like cognate immunity protein n=1 Tax=Variovorax sp. PAMC26660 TaxID=2762322 RepID=UPI0021C39C6C|nr:PoNi-like cognate immunity protein [Variovorax sp. PAMC26660]
MDEARALERDDDLTYRIGRYTPEIDNSEIVVAARSSFAWSVATSSLELLILRYTAGHPVDELVAELPAVIAAFDRYIPLDNPPPHEAHTLTITQHEAYVYVLWLLSLCRLLGHDKLVPIIIGWLDQQAEFNRGRDGLFESIVEKLTRVNVPAERVLLHPAAYKPLAKVTVASEEDRPARMQEFLDGWYKNMKECYWHDTHKDGEGSSYFGYWAFEAALVTVLWDMDDSSYRDHLVYPKDLADWAREHRTEASPSGPGRTSGGAPCAQAE